jgi:hypothetical protein
MAQRALRPVDRNAPLLEVLGTFATTPLQVPAGRGWDGGRVSGRGPEAPSPGGAFVRTVVVSKATTLSERKVKDHTDRQSRLNRDVRVSALARFVRIGIEGGSTEQEVRS